MDDAAPPRRTRRFLRQGLKRSLRQHYRKMTRIDVERRRRQSALQAEERRLQRLAAQAQQREEQESAPKQKRRRRAQPAIAV